MSEEFVQHALGAAERFDRGDVVLGKHVSTYMRQWGQLWDGAGDKMADFTPLLVVSRLVKEGLIVDPARRSYSVDHLMEIGKELEIQHIQETSSYVSNLALDKDKQVNKQVGKDTMLMLEAAMKDCRYEMSSASILSVLP
jgi:hypothetical protein